MGIIGGIKEAELIKPGPTCFGDVIIEIGRSTVTMGGEVSKSVNAGMISVSF